MDLKTRISATTLGLLAIGATLLVAWPYAQSVLRENRAFTDYVRETLREPAQPLPWVLREVSPEECIALAGAWVDGCPGVDEFCNGALPEFMRVCLGSADRASYCAAQGDAIFTTGFGYHACEALLDGLDRSRSKQVEKHCAAGYRAVADHCRDLREQR